LESRKPARIRISCRQALALLVPYVTERIMAQVRSVWLIILYLVVFQTLILRIDIYDASVIAVGIGLVVAGLTVFMEGLFLGLMRLGTLVGSGLPRKAPVLCVLGFGLLLGFLATLAEPSIQVLQMAGKSVKPWEAPLLFLLLNKHAGLLVYSVGAGVGIAVLLGMLRFYYSLSLKPFIYILIGTLSILTLWAHSDDSLRNIIGLAWDCGAVTTGPVTVPLVLALGIGISRMVGSADSGATGLGVVTLASLLPVITVLGLGFFFNGKVPQPMSESEFFDIQNRPRVEALFTDRDQMLQYGFTEAGPQAQLSFFSGSREEMRQDLRYLKAHPQWQYPAPTLKATQMIDLKESESSRKAGLDNEPSATVQTGDLVRKHLLAALKAIGFLTVPILLIFFLVIRERLPYPDEIFLGIVFCVLGLALFGIGIELGLDRLGNQIGSKLPAAFKAIPLPEEQKIIAPFDTDLVQTAVTPDGDRHPFFFFGRDENIHTIAYDPSNYDPAAGRYRHIPAKGPIFGAGSPVPGIVVVILFAFIMGYGATLAEPALNALGATVEELTAGSFKKTLLIQAVAIGVGSGIALGITKVILNIPLAWILVPPYLLLLLATWLSSEDFVNIGWDSAGVTTGPITVPLVLAMGLGIGSQVGVVEGFGILATASVFPILSVLLLGLHVNRKRQAALAQDAGIDNL
jgi:hypothetical protein